MDIGRKFGGAGSPSDSVAWAKAYHRVKFHFDPSNRLATIHQRHRQTGQRAGSIGLTVLQTVAQKTSSIHSYISTKHWLVADRHGAIADNHASIASFEFERRDLDHTHWGVLSSQD